MQSHPRLSVVIPVYNAEEWLADALDSVLATPANCPVEIICINDGSTDSSTEILRTYCAEHPNITVITQENTGHAAARNIGLREASGDYVWFVDADDYLETGCVGHAVHLMDIHCLDILAVPVVAVPFDSKYTPTTPTWTTTISRVAPPSSACSGGRVFRRAILTQNAIEWREELSPNDDTVFLFETSFHACHVGYNVSMHYFHRNHTDSVSHNRSQDALAKRLRSFLRMAQIFAEYLPRARNRVERRQVESRVALSVQGILFDLVRVKPTELRDSMLQELRAAGLYPYRPVAYNLRPKINAKITLLNWSMYLFPFEPYYRAYYALLHGVYVRRLSS